MAANLCTAIANTDLGHFPSGPKSTDPGHSFRFNNRPSLLCFGDPTAVEERKPPGAPERALWLAILKRAIDDAAMLPKHLWDDWLTQVKILELEAENVPFELPYQRHKALERVIVARNRLQLARDAYEWLESSFCELVRHFAGVENIPFEIPDRHNQPLPKQPFDY